jgi:hypothetical protein
MVVSVVVRLPPFNAVSHDDTCSPVYQQAHGGNVDELSVRPSVSSMSGVIVKKSLSRHELHKAIESVIATPLEQPRRFTMVDSRTAVLSSSVDSEDDLLQVAKTMTSFSSHSLPVRDFLQDDEVLLIDRKNESSVSILSFISTFFALLLFGLEMLSSLMSLKALPVRPVPYFTLRPKHRPSKLSLFFIVLFFPLWLLLRFQWLRNRLQSWWNAAVALGKKKQHLPAVSLLTLSSAESALLVEGCRKNGVSLDAWFSVALSVALHSSISITPAEELLPVWNRIRLPEPSASVATVDSPEHVENLSMDCFYRVRGCPCSVSNSQDAGTAIHHWRTWFWNHCSEVKASVKWNEESGASARSALFQNLFSRWLVWLSAFLPYRWIVAPTFTLAVTTASAAVSTQETCPELFILDHAQLHCYPQFHARVIVQHPLVRKNNDFVRHLTGTPSIQVALTFPEECMSRVCCETMLAVHLRHVLNCACG